MTFCDTRACPHVFLCALVLGCGAYTPYVQVWWLNVGLEVLKEVWYGNSIRCVVVTGSGGKSFCSGGGVNGLDTLDVVTGFD